ncbi:MAG: alpha/beta hydrolase [Lachnospiraceae bacterium]|jgi:acetyl esterase/lipase|nr:alpha/beta hydrolase [Lachnospiraceae bacterium]
MHIETFSLHDFFPTQHLNPDATLTVYLLDSPSKAINAKPRPLVLICPGGGYMYISDREAEPVALRFASMGYHAAILRYGVLTPHPAPVRELAASVLLAKQAAASWNVDDRSILLCGFSAGGHMCALYSVYWNQPLLCDFFDRPPLDFQVAACILGYPVTDYVAMADTPKAPAIQDYCNRAEQAMFGTAPLTLDVLKAVSPTLLAGGQIPPTFLWATTQDELVPVLQSTGYLHALAANKIPFEAHIFESGPHGLVLADASTAVHAYQVNTDAAVWILLLQSWLKKRFLIDPIE